MDPHGGLQSDPTTFGAAHASYIWGGTILCLRSCIDVLRSELGPLEDNAGKIREFLDGFAEAHREPDDTRPQHLLEAPVEVIPVDDQFRCRQQPLNVMTRDLSVDGMGFWSDEPLHADFAIVRMIAEDGSVMSVGTKVLRCQERDNRFDVGCQFMLADMHAS